MHHYNQQVWDNTTMTMTYYAPHLHGWTLYRTHTEVFLGARSGPTEPCSKEHTASDAQAKCLLPALVGIGRKVHAWISMIVCWAEIKVERIVCQIACPWPMITANMIIMEIVKQQIVCSKPSSLLPKIPTSASSSLAEEQCCPPRLQHPKRCSDYCNLHRFIEAGGTPLQSLLSTIII